MILARPAFADLPIARKIAFIVILSSALALLIACTGFVTVELLSSRGNATTRLQGIGELVANQTAPLLSDHDPSAAAGVLSALAAEELIESACLYAPNGQLFADWFRRPSALACPAANEIAVGAHRTGSETLVSLPVSLTQNDAGSLVIRSRSLALLPVLGRHTALVALLLCVSAAVAGLLASLLQRLITGPIVRLIDTSRNVAETGDYSMRVDETGQDELGVLVSSYNEMLARVEERDRTLEEDRDRLDEALQTRSAELATTQEELQDQVVKRERAEARVRDLAYYDNLTGLPNRQYLRERLNEAIRNARRDDDLVALLFIDLDRFKEINDSFGHSTGDEVLGLVAQRLSECVRDSDQLAIPVDGEQNENSVHAVYRQGGDEFTILLTRLGNSFDASRVATRILDAMKAPFLLDGQEVVIGASIGISVFPHDGDDTDTLLKHADTAMYHAKKAGKNDYEYFSESMKEEALQKLTIEAELRKAIERKEFEIYYQPKVDGKTDRVCGLEVLLRWRHPERGLISPNEFIPVAEETGLIVPIGEWVLRVACSQTRTWHNSGVHNVPIAVNVSSRQFRKNSLMETVTEILAESGLAPRQLEIEVTESTMLQDEEEAISALARLKALGIQVALDDFGTGYSSLSYVRRLPLDTIKIDRSFVKELGRDAESASIVTAIIAMAHSLGLRVVAEGVETEEQADFLRSQGCEELQGFLFSEPLPASAIPGLLEGEKKLRRVT